MPTIHDDAHALDWNKLFHSLNGMPKHRTRSNDIREIASDSPDLAEFSNIRAFERHHHQPG